MIRFLFRFLSMISLSVAVIMAVVDATRSIAANAPVLTPLGSSWMAVSPKTLIASQAVVQNHILPALWDPVIVHILMLPGFVVFLALALLFYLAGRKPERRGLSGRVAG